MKKTSTQHHYSLALWASVANQPKRSISRSSKVDSRWTSDWPKPAGSRKSPQGRAWSAWLVGKLFESAMRLYLLRPKKSWMLQDILYHVEMNRLAAKLNWRTVLALLCMQRYINSVHCCHLLPQGRPQCGRFTSMSKKPAAGGKWRVAVPWMSITWCQHIISTTQVIIQDSIKRELQ